MTPCEPPGETASGRSEGRPGSRHRRSEATRRYIWPRSFHPGSGMHEMSRRCGTLSFPTRRSSSQPEVFLRSYVPVDTSTPSRSDSAWGAAFAREVLGAQQADGVGLDRRAVARRCGGVGREPGGGLAPTATAILLGPRARSTPPRGPLRRRPDAPFLRPGQRRPGDHHSPEPDEAMGDHDVRITRSGPARTPGRRAACPACGPSPDALPG